jgi:hypothetical protein
MAARILSALELLEELSRSNISTQWRSEVLTITHGFLDSELRKITEGS